MCNVEHFGRVQAAKNTVILVSYCDTTEYWIKKQEAWGLLQGSCYLTARQTSFSFVTCES